jgi:LysM repeat protein
MMKKYTPWIFLVLLVLMIGSTACTRSAYKAPVTGVEPSPTIPFPVATQPDVMAEVKSGTETAQAILGTILPTQPISIATQPVGTVEVVTAAPTNTVPPVVVPTATPGLPDTYALQKGESPYCIARRFNLSPLDLFSLNGLTGNETAFPVGYELKIPQDSKWNLEVPRALVAHPVKYTVASGDTIYTIACHFGDVDPNVIIAANSLAAPYELSPGQVLQIP